MQKRNNVKYSGISLGRPTQNVQKVHAHRWWYKIRAKKKKNMKKLVQKNLVAEKEIPSQISHPKEIRLYISLKALGWSHFVHIDNK